MKKLLSRILAVMTVMVLSVGICGIIGINASAGGAGFDGPWCYDIVSGKDSISIMALKNPEAEICADKELYLAVYLYDKTTKKYKKCKTEKKVLEYTYDVKDVNTDGLPEYVFNEDGTLNTNYGSFPVELYGHTLDFIQEDMTYNIGVYTIKGLKPGKTYKIKIVAYFKGKDGKSVKWGEEKITVKTQSKSKK